MAMARVLKRVPFVRDVIINGSMKVRAVDLSEGGLYVHTGRSIMPGQIVEVAIPFAGEYITVKAKVVHRQEAVGMGLMFIGLTYRDRVKIGQLIDDVSGGSRMSGTRQDHEKKRILLIEDNASTQRIYKSRLVFDGFSVVTANNGIEALKLLREPSPDAIDLIVLDLYMSVLDGFHFLNASKKMPKIKDIPVIVLTARISGEAVRKAREGGAETILQKASTSPSALAASIRRTFDSEKRQGQKVNCWEFMKCNRTPFDGPVDKNTICPVALEVRLDGVHGGKNAGRACWALGHTVCEGKVQGAPSQKFGDCLKCPFYKALKKEEGEHYRDTLYLLERLQR